MSFREEFKQRVLNASIGDFEMLALELFRYQANENEVYKQFMAHLGTDVDAVKSVEQIPFLPIEFFKTHSIRSTQLPVEKVFTSSGTTGQQTSKHYVADAAFYLNNAQRIFEQQYGSLQDFVVFGLLPSYLEREGSSLIDMVKYFIDLTASDLSGFYLNEYEQLILDINKAAKSDKKILLIGVTFGLLDFAERQQHLPKHTIVMETGGMKGRREELTRGEIHQELSSKLGIETIHSEYGMTELLSQVYSSGNGVFVCNSAMQLYLRDVTDPLFCSTKLQSGGINVIDLANVDSCGFIATQDLGKRTAHGFEILGRIDNSDIRGCNLMVSSL